MKKFWWVIIICISLLTSCGTSSALNSASPVSNGETKTSIPTHTATDTLTPTSTQVPTATPTLALPVREQTPIPQSASAIAENNINQVAAIAHWGVGEILGAATTADLSFMAITTTAYGVEMFDMKAGKLMWSQNTLANAPSLSSDGSLLALATQNGIEVWNAATGEMSLQLKSEDGPFTVYDDPSRLNESTYVEKIAFSPDGHYLAAQIYSYQSDSPYKVFIWRMPDGQLVKTLQNSIWGFEFSPDSTLLAANDAIWNVADWTRAVGIPGIDVSATGSSNILFHFSDDGQYFAIYTQDQLDIYKMPSGQLFRVTNLSLEMGNDFWLKNGLVISSQATINIKNGTSSKTLVPYTPVSPNTYYEEGFSLQNYGTAAVSSDGSSAIIRINNQVRWIDSHGNPISKIDWAPKTAEDYGNFPTGSSPLEYSPDSGSIIFGTQLINVDNGNILKDIGYYNGNLPQSLLGLKNGTFLEPKQQGNDLEFYSYPGEQPQLTLQGVGTKRMSFSLSPDKSTLVIISYNTSNITPSTPAYISLWRMSDGAQIKKLVCGNYVSGIAFSKDSTLLAASCGSNTSSSRVNIWHISDGSLVKILTDNIFGDHITFSLDGELMASNAYSSTKRQDVERLYQVSNWKIYGEIGSQCTSSVFTSDSSVLICSTQSGTLQFWRTSDLTLIREVSVYPGIPALVLAVSSDGKYIASAWKDNTFIIWAISQSDQ